MRRKIACLWLAVCLLVTALGGCKSHNDGSGGGFRFPLAAEPLGLDPQMAEDDASITVLCALFEGLTRLDENGKAIPAAASWTVSEDGQTYTFTLKDSYWNQNPVKGQENPWDNPLPVTADDFLFAFHRLADPAIGSPLSGELTGIANAKEVLAGDLPVEQLGVKAVDEKTLTIRLAAPDDDFPARLAGSPFFPCHRAFFEATAGRYGLEEQYLLTNGAFRLAAWNHNESLLMYKHEQYHDAAAIAPEAVRFVIGTEDALVALQNGDLSAAPLTVAQAAEAGKSINVSTLEDSVRSVWLNTAAAPLNQAEIRAALRDSIQWDSVDAYLAETGEAIATGYIPPAATVDGEIYRAADNALPRATDTAAATANLQKGVAALYPDGDGSPSRIRIELLAAEDAVSADLARYILQSWQKNLSISVTLRLVSQQELTKRVKSGDYQAALYTHTPSGLTGGENLACFGTDAGGNLARLSDKAVDLSLAAAKQGGRADLRTAETVLWTVCPAIPISFPCRYYGFAKNTADIVARPFGGGQYQSELDFRHAKAWG